MCESLTGEVRAFGEEQQLQRFLDVAEILQHVGHVTAVFLPAAMDEDEGGHLHGPACTHRHTLYSSITQPAIIRSGSLGLTEPGHGLQRCFQADLLQTQVAVAQQAAPQEHPVQTCTVVHDDDTALTGNEAVARYDHFHPEHQLQQRLRRQTDPFDSSCRLYDFRNRQTTTFIKLLRCKKIQLTKSV